VLRYWSFAEIEKIQNKKKKENEKYLNVEKMFQETIEIC
jgi:hypothetical protein